MNCRTSLRSIKYPVLVALLCWPVPFSSREPSAEVQRISPQQALRHALGESVETVGGGPTGQLRISRMGPDGDLNFDAFFAAVAYNSVDHEYLVVWQGDDDTFPLVDNETEIFGQRIDAATGAELGEDDFRISDMGPDGDSAFDAERVAVAYNSTDNEYLVVWQGDDDTPPLSNNESEIFGQRIDGATGAELGENDFRISDMGPDGSPTFDAQGAAIAYSGVAKEFLVVWTGDDDTPPRVDEELEIFGQRIDAATGAEIGDNDFRISDLGPDGDPDYDALAPAVAYNSASHEYLVVWQGDDGTPPLVDNEVEIFGQRIDAATGAELGENDFRISEMGPDGNPRYAAAEPAVAFSSAYSIYLVVWSGDDNTPPLVDNELEIYGQRIDAATGAQLVGPNFRISDMGPDGDSGFDAFRPALSHDGPEGGFLLVWEGDDDTPPLVAGESEIFGKLWSSTVFTDGFELGDTSAWSDSVP